MNLLTNDLRRSQQWVGRNAAQRRRAMLHFPPSPMYHRALQLGQVYSSTDTPFWRRIARFARRKPLHVQHRGASSVSLDRVPLNIYQVYAFQV